MAPQHEEPQTGMPEKPIMTTKEEIIRIVGRFLPKEWKFLKAEEVNISRMQ
jgi:hypothetical protein